MRNFYRKYRKGIIKIILMMNLFYLGLLLNHFLHQDLKQGKELFWQISPMIAPLLISIALFIELRVIKKRNVE